MAMPTALARSKAEAFAAVLANLSRVLFQHDLPFLSLELLNQLGHTPFLYYVLVQIKDIAIFVPLGEVKPERMSVNVPFHINLVRGHFSLKIFFQLLFLR